MPQWLSPSSVTRVGTPRTPASSATRADLANLLEALVRVCGRYSAVSVEPGPVRCASELAVGRDVLSLAEERLVKRVLERSQRVLLARPEARGQGSVDRGW